jgi:hypothetical protein
MFRTALIFGTLVFGVIASPAHAEMSVATFLAKADALKAKGMMAMMSSDIGLLKDEMKVATTAYRAQLVGDKAAKRPAHSCPPEKAQMNSDELMTYFRTIPATQQPRTSVKAGFFGMMKKKFPCPAS